MFRCSMPFGKYQGRFMEEIPSSYLEWVLTFAYSDWLIEGIKEELGKRDEEFTIPNTPSQANLREHALEIISAGRKAQMKKHHPDVGGTDESAQGVNLAHDWLQLLVGKSES
jgi:Putative quorum-sensing-regulated virulence factor